MHRIAQYGLLMVPPLTCIGERRGSVDCGGRRPRLVVCSRAVVVDVWHVYVAAPSPPRLTPHTRPGAPVSDFHFVAPTKFQPD